MPATIFDLKWSDLNIPYGLTDDVCSRYRSRNAEALDCYLRRLKARHHCKKWGEDGLWYKGDQLGECHIRGESGHRNRMDHIQKVRPLWHLNEAYANAARTLARSRQIEAEERANSRKSPTMGEDFARGEFSDDQEDQVATLIRDDQIDFLENEDEPDRYRDEEADVEDNVFKYGDGGDEEEAIGLDNQKPSR